MFLSPILILALLFSSCDDNSGKAPEAKPSSGRVILANISGIDEGETSVSYWWSAPGLGEILSGKGTVQNGYPVFDGVPADVSSMSIVAKGATSYYLASIRGIDLSEGECVKSAEFKKQTTAEIKVTAESVTFPEGYKIPAGKTGSISLSPQSSKGIIIIDSKTGAVPYVVSLTVDPNGKITPPTGMLAAVDASSGDASGSLTSAWSASLGPGFPSGENGSSLSAKKADVTPTYDSSSLTFGDLSALAFTVEVNATSIAIDLSTQIGENKPASESLGSVALTPPSDLSAKPILGTVKTDGKVEFPNVNIYAEEASLEKPWTITGVWQTKDGYAVIGGTTEITPSYENNALTFSTLTGLTVTKANTLAIKGEKAKATGLLSGETGSIEISNVYLPASNVQLEGLSESPLAATFIKVSVNGDSSSVTGTLVLKAGKELTEVTSLKGMSFTGVQIGGKGRLYDMTLSGTVTESTMTIDQNEGISFRPAETD